MHAGAVSLSTGFFCLRFRLLVVSLGVAAAGCGSAGGEGGEGEAALDWGWANTTTLAASAGAVNPLSNDLVPVPALPELPAATDPGDGTTAPVEILEAAGDPTTGGRPKVFYLNYADGKALPRTNPNPCQATAPKFTCSFAPTLVECQRQIQAFLDKWYADFNVIFTLTRPTSGTFYTEVVSSGGGAWCGAASNVAGVAPFLCEDLAGGAAYTFLGGKNAKETAIIIAQEHAHLVGLEHTASTKDIMDPTICPNCDGFENVVNRVQNSHCGRNTQNSYQMMKDRLGVWTGGIKPTPFGCDHDTQAPLVRIQAPIDNATVSGNFPLVVQASDECKISRVSVTVSPMGLQTQSTSSPFEWTLTKIKGRQTITVTATDPSGKTSTASVTVNAPGSPTSPGPDGGSDGAAESSDGGLTQNPAAAAGCACDAGGTAAPGQVRGWAAAGLLLLAVTLARRRSRGAALVLARRGRASRFFTRLRERP